jgi:hypothetical protein
MLTYARLSPGRGFRPRRALLYYAQRLVGLRAARRAVSALIASGVSAANRQPRPKPLGAAGRLALGSLRRDGIARLAPLAGPEQIEAMVDYFRARPVIVDRKTVRPLASLSSDVAVAEYDLDTVLGCPGLLQMVNAPEILDLAEGYLGCRPTLSSLGVRWTFPVPLPPARFQEFHRDIDDWRFIKLLVYLTPVTEAAGPHEYVLGSHLGSFGPRAKAYGRRELVARYGASNVVAVLGEPGTAFVGDTIGIHRGGTPVSEPRLLLLAQYSLLPVYAFSYQPRECSLAGAVDAYCNRLIIRPPDRSREASPAAASI